MLNSLPKKGSTLQTSYSSVSAPALLFYDHKEPELLIDLECHSKPFVWSRLEGTESPVNVQELIYNSINKLTVIVSFKRFMVFCMTIMLTGTESTQLIMFKRYSGYASMCESATQPDANST